MLVFFFICLFFTSCMCEQWQITGHYKILPYHVLMQVCLLRKVKYSRLWTRMMLCGGRLGNYQILVPVLDWYPQTIFWKGKVILIFTISSPVLLHKLLSFIAVILSYIWQVSLLLLFSGLFLSFFPSVCEKMFFRTPM